MSETPDPLHSHYHPGRNRFVEHEHEHDGLHYHDTVYVNGAPIPVTIPMPGNYSPHGLRENRTEEEQ